MSSLLRGLTTAVAARPLAVVVVAVLLTVGLGGLAGQATVVNDNAAFSPRTDEVLAAEEIQARFADTSTATLQVIVRGDDVISPEGVTTVTRIEELATERFGDALAAPGGGPAIVSYLQPARFAARASGADLAAADAATVDTLQERGLAGPPPGAAPGDTPDGAAAPDPSAFLSQLSAGDEAATAPSGLVLIQMARSAFADNVALGQEQVAFADDVATADLPLEAIPFSFDLVSQPDDDFQQEIGQLFALAALVILVVLALVLRARRGPRLGLVAATRRSLADMGLSMLTVVMAVGWTQGLLVLLGPDYVGLLGQPSPPTQIVPILLLALGVDYAIHLQSRYREELAAGGSPTDVTGRLGGTVGVALFLSMFTTGLGFVSNVVSPIPAIRDLGILAAVGILVVFLLTATFLPAARLLLDRRAERRGGAAREEIAPREDGLFSRIAQLGLKPALRVPGATLAVVGVLAVAGGYGLTQLETVFSVTAFLPEDSPAKVAFETLAEDFDGGLAETTDVLVTGDAILTPDVHNATAAVATSLAGEPGIVQLGDVADATTPVGVLRTAVATAEGPDQTAAVATATDAGLTPDGTVTDDADVAAVYDAMAAAFPTVAQTVDVAADPALRLSVRTQSDTVGTEELAAAVEEAVTPIEDAGATTVVTSDAIINQNVVTSLASSQVTGLVITVVVVMILMGLVYGIRQRRPLLGVLVVLPVAAVLLWVFGLMAASGIPFDPITAVMSALVVGVGVDFCIHLGERFVEDMETADGDVAAALRTSLHHTGGALAGSAATTTLGFLVLTTTSIVPFQRLGVVLIYAISLSLFATVFVLPPMLVLYARHRWEHGGAAEAPA